MDKIVYTFNVSEYINKLFDKSNDNINFDYYHEENLTHVSMNLNWSEEDKNQLIDDFLSCFNEINKIKDINSEKALEISNKYFKDYNNNKYLENLCVFGARINRLIYEKCPYIIFENEIKTSINLILLNHFATRAYITREISELIEFNKQ